MSLPLTYMNLSRFSYILKLTHNNKQKKKKQKNLETSELMITAKIESEKCDQLRKHIQLKFNRRVLTVSYQVLFTIRDRLSHFGPCRTQMF